MEKRYRVQDVSKMLKIPSSTLRYYDNEGLIPNLGKDENGIRYFTKNNIDTLYTINCLKKANMSLKEIKDFLGLVEKGDSTIEKRHEMFLKKKEDVLSQINDMKEILDYLEYKIWFYETAKELGSVDKALCLTNQSIPKNIINLKNKIDAKKGILDTQK